MNHVSPWVTSASVWSQTVALSDTVGTLGSGLASKANLPQDLSLLDDTRQQAVVPGGPGLQRLPGDHPWRKCFAERSPNGREIVEGISRRGVLSLPTHEWGKGKEKERRASTKAQHSLAKFVFNPSPLSCVKYIPWEKKTFLRAVLGEHYSFLL